MPFDENYFSTHTYANITFAKYSMYWWSNRFFAMLARRNGRRGARLLEVGSGMGHLVGQLEDTFETYGCDINHWAVKQSQPVVKKTSLQTASAQELPFNDNSFNVVIIKHIVEHLPDPQKAIQEIGRVIEPGGALILATPNLDSLLKPWKGEKWIGYQDPTHISLKRPAEWVSLIEGAGFTITRIFSDGFWDVPYIPLIPNAVQKLTFGSFGGFQAITGLIFLPMRWGESIIVIARKQKDK
ncbi:MAG TPA: methyltransferase domain-containing protein [Anaerolineales bacterium]|nr:methyltransferase domain-containing protein [Anaerolineales bacterium]HNQ95234.1 methyltransferase domain-containing protein [Anaerolineales bacterium]HNS60649.1 methyltransferase domain-containing protein [Anaerolineales bacterium]